MKRQSLCCTRPVTAIQVSSTGHLLHPQPPPLTLYGQVVSLPLSHLTLPVCCCQQECVYSSANLLLLSFLHAHTTVVAWKLSSTQILIFLFIRHWALHEYEMYVYAIEHTKGSSNAHTDNLCNLILSSWLTTKLLSLIHSCLYQLLAHTLDQCSFHTTSCKLNTFKSLFIFAKFAKAFNWKSFSMPIAFLNL